MGEKVVIKQDAGFVYYADGSKDGLEEYRKKKGLPSRAEAKETRFKKYREDNKEWLGKKAKGQLKNLDEIT